MCIHMYICIYIERERYREREGEIMVISTLLLPGRRLGEVLDLARHGGAEEQGLALACGPRL